MKRNLLTNSDKPRPAAAKVGANRSSWLRLVMGVVFVVIVFVLSINAKGQTAWINEFHYDNVGTDAGEAIEIVIVNPGSYSLSLFRVDAYNGADGTSYMNATLNNFTVGSTSGSATIYSKTFAGLQNGAPDGIALSYNGTLIQFISYEGSFTATAGVADGITSTNIGVSQDGTSAVGLSLQLSGTGCQYSDFTWQGSAANTWGAVNNSQTLCTSSPTITVTPTTLTGFTYVEGSGPSAEQSYVLGGSNLTAGPITVTAPTNYEISLTSGSGFGSSVSVSYTAPTLSNTTIYVRLKAGLAANTYNGETISNAGGGATTVNVTCSGNVTTPSTTCISEGFNAGTTAPAGWTFTGIGTTYTTSGNFGASSPSLGFDATGDQIVTPTVTSAIQLSFWIKGQSTDATSALLVEGYNGSWVAIDNITNSIPTTGTTFTYNSSSTPALAPGFTQFRFTYTKSAGNLSFDDVNVLCSAGPTITCGTLAGFGEVCVGSTSAEQTYIVSGVSLSNSIVITPPANFEISLSSGSGFVANPSTLTLTQSGGVVNATTIYVRFKPTAATTYSGNITHTSTGATSKNVAVSGTGATASSITMQPLNRSVSDGGTTTFSVTATVVSFYQWQLSTDGGAVFNNLSNGGVYSNVTTSTMSIIGADITMTGNKYRCVITSACSGSVTSNAATLTVTTGSVWLIDEGFDGTTTIASLASTTTGPFTASAGLFTGSSATVANRSTKALFLTGVGTLTSPAFSNGDLLAFWMGLASGTSGNGVQLDVETTIDGSTWTTLATFTSIPVQTRFYFYTIGSNVTQVRFVYDPGSNNNLYFDDVMVRGAGQCSATPLIEKVHVNSCGNTQEGENEFVLVDVDEDINVDDLLITFPSADPGTLSFCMDCDKVFVANTTYTAALNTEAGCTIAYNAAPGGVIPAGSKLIIFTGAEPDFTYDLGGACGSGISYYALYCNNFNTSGRFANAPGSTTYKFRYVSIVDQASGCYDQVFYDEFIPNTDGEFAAYDLTSRAMTYGNNGCTEAIVSLPVELLYFSSFCSDNSVKLYWSTATETNNAYFTIEAADAANGDFVPVAKVDGAGNSNEMLEYSIDVDTKAKYFRLKQTDYDGKFTYSDVIAVDCEDSPVQLFPSLAAEGENITIIGEVSSVRVFDSMGREVFPEFNENKVCCLESGMYFFVINGKWNHKVVVQ